MPVRRRFLGIDLLDRISAALNLLSASSPGLYEATPNLKAQSKANRGGRDEPGHDPRKTDRCSNPIEIRSRESVSTAIR